MNHVNQLTAVVTRSPWFLGIVLGSLACTEIEPSLERQEVGSGTVPPFEGRTVRIETVDTLVRFISLGDTNTFGSPTAMIGVGNRLLVADKFTSPHLTLIETTTGQMVGDFGANGNGPTEFLQPLWFFSDASSRERVWIHDLGKRDLTLVNLNLPTDSNLVRRIQYNPPVQILFPVVTRDTVLAVAASPWVGLWKLTLGGTVVDSVIVDFPFGEKEAPGYNAQLMANSRRLAFHPTTHDLVVAYLHANRLDYHAPNGAYRGTVTGPRANRVNFGFRDEQFGFEPGHQAAYMNVTATRRYVYALFCGCQAAFGYDKVHVFDWAGNFVREVVLDHAVAAIWVDATDTRLFGVSHEPWPNVGVWQLPN